MFGDLALDKPITIEIEERELELNMTADDLKPLISLGQTQKMEEDHVEKLTEALRKILERSYLPHYDEAKDQPKENLTAEQKQENEEAKKIIEGLLVRYYLKIFMEITKALNWQDEGDIRQTLKEGKRETSLKADRTGTNS